MLVLDNASIASESDELRQCLDLWRRVQEGGGGGGSQPLLVAHCTVCRCALPGKVAGLQPGRARRAHLPFMCCPAPSLTHPLPDWLSCCAERWGRDWALLALAAADNTALCLEHYCDALAQ